MCIEASSSEGASLKAVPVLNAMYELLQIHKRNMCALEEMEKEQLKKLSTLEHIQISNSRLKASMYGTSVNFTFYMCIHRFEMTCNYSQSVTTCSWLKLFCFCIWHCLAVDPFVSFATVSYSENVWGEIIEFIFCNGFLRHGEHGSVSELASLCQVRVISWWTERQSQN